MTDPELFIAADQYLNSVVQQFKDEDWSRLVPDWIAMGSHLDRTGMTLRTLINYHAYDDIWVPDMLAGRTMDEVGKDKWRDEDLLGEDPKGRFASIVEQAVTAARALTPERLQSTAHLSFGDFTIEEYLWQITQFRTLRAHEFALVIGVDATIPEVLAQGVYDQLAPQVEAWRAMGVFGPAIEVEANAPIQDRLLGLTGRDPRQQV